MSLIRTTHPMLGLQQQINRMFDQFDSDLFGHLENLGEGMFAPAVDVKEDADAYTVHLEVPGVAQDKLQLMLQDNVLTIKGAKEQKTEDSEGRYRRVERSYGNFARSLSLPRSVDPNAVTANLEDGVLEVRLPKREDARPRQINVGTTRNAVESINMQSNTENDEAATTKPVPSEDNAKSNDAPEDDSQRANEQAVGGNSDDAPEGNPT